MQYREDGFDARLGTKTPHATGQLSTHAATKTQHSQNSKDKTQFQLLKKSLRSQASHAGSHSLRWQTGSQPAYRIPAPLSYLLCSKARWESRYLDPHTCINLSTLPGSFWTFTTSRSPLLNTSLGTQRHVQRKKQVQNSSVNPASLRQNRSS